MLANQKGRKPFHGTFPSIFQGDALKWEEGILRLYRECWGGRAKEEHTTQNTVGFTAMMANLTTGVQLMGVTKCMSMCACCSHRSVASVTGSLAWLGRPGINHLLTQPFVPAALARHRLGEACELDDGAAGEERDPRALTWHC